MSILETTRCLVLNASYEPLTVVNAKRALKLYYEGKVDIVEEHEDYIIHSERDIWPLPTTIVLKKYVTSKNFYTKEAILTQKNLFIRDNYTCQYCDRHRSQLNKSEMLTRDHVFPKERGGEDKWTNVVTACSTCNNKKANHLIGSLRCEFQLKREPYAPTMNEIWVKTNYRKVG